MIVGYVMGYLLMGILVASLFWWFVVVNHPEEPNSSDMRWLLATCAVWPVFAFLAIVLKSGDWSLAVTKKMWLRRKRRRERKRSIQWTSGSGR